MTFPELRAAGVAVRADRVRPPTLGLVTADADGLEWEQRPGDLRRPVLVAAFEGWNDAGDAATFAVRWLAKHGETRRIATI
jgi:hypothetical protein